ncbi:peptidase S1 [Blomia tropicalis]|nr:peptidase S1 [Blomia tropicalis]
MNVRLGKTIKCHDQTRSLITFCNDHQTDRKLFIMKLYALIVLPLFIGSLFVNGKSNDLHEQLNNSLHQNVSQTEPSKLTEEHSDSTTESLRKNETETEDSTQQHETFSNESVSSISHMERCEMANNAIGVCQPAIHCMVQDFEESKFHVCKWTEEKSKKLSTHFCCPQLNMTETELEYATKQWSKNYKSEYYAHGLPKKPDDTCGMSYISTEVGNEEEILRNQNNNNKVRIVNGRSSRLGEVPWMAAIYYKDKFVCGGSIISSRHILTAAHCFFNYRNKNDYIIRYGSIEMFNGTENRVEEIIVHENYSPPSIYDDIALLKLKHLILMDRYIQPICLPGKRMVNKYMVDKMATVSGFGDLEFGGPQTTDLQDLEIKIINSTYCTKSYKRLYKSDRKFKHGIGKTLICAGFEDGGKDACQGDSGGPLTVNYYGANYLIGIVSFGYRCATAEYPGVYTCVAYYLKWIFENVHF